MDPEDLIYDWNLAGGAIRPVWDPVLLADETLRDGLQSPSVVSPTIEQKIELLHLMAALEIDIADIGMPGTGSHHILSEKEILAVVAALEGGAVKSEPVRA
jgi:isopropylmalate/homocitrate/citramalate synthase